MREEELVAAIRSARYDKCYIAEGCEGDESVRGPLPVGQAREDMTVQCMCCSTLMTRPGEHNWCETCMTCSDLPEGETFCKTTL